MNKREKKAVEIERANYADVMADMTDEELLQTIDVQATLKAMDWMAQECASVHAKQPYHKTIWFSGALKRDLDNIKILNAGKEEV